MLVYFLQIFFKYLYSDSAIDIMDADFFPDSTAQASCTVAKAQRKQIKAGGTVQPNWGVDDHLIALGSRIKLLRVLGVDLVNAAIRARSILWPDTELSPHM